MFNKLIKIFRVYHISYNNFDFQQPLRRDKELHRLITALSSEQIRT